MSYRTPIADEYLSIADLCDLLRIVRHTEWLWRKDGSGPPFVRAGGRRVLYRKADVDKWLAMRTFAHSAAELTNTPIAA